MRINHSYLQNSGVKTPTQKKLRNPMKKIKKLVRPLALIGDQSRTDTWIKLTTFLRMLPTNPGLALLLEHIQMFQGGWELSRLWCPNRYPTKEDLQPPKESLKSRSNKELLSLKPTAYWLSQWLLPPWCPCVSWCDWSTPSTCFTPHFLSYGYIIRSPRQGVSRGLFSRQTMRSLFYY